MKQQGWGESERRQEPIKAIGGFTLIELLVVISIIALLLAILLPGLQSAKRAAESVVCRAHMKGTGDGLGFYTHNYDGWLPGPNTSGRRIAQLSSLPDRLGTLEPTQNVDWVSPSLGDSLGLPNQTIDKILKILNTELRCPSNRVKYDYVYPGALPGVEPQEIHFASYSSSLAFHMYSQNMKASNEGWVTDNEVSTSYRISPGYFPKIERVGTASRKIWVMEGARYYDPTLGTSFNNLPYQNDGGNFMITGPVFKMPTGDPFIFEKDGNTWNLTETSERLAYRHRGRINACFFDGHCETLTLEESLVPSYYFPSGTYITALGAKVMQASNVSEGYIR